MKPGRRRLLIPGLLIALLVVVALAAVVREANAQTTPVPVVPHTQVSTIDDPRVLESSGLVASRRHPGLAYTINDSGDVARVFAIDIASGDVVGVTTVDAVWHDAEAMSIHDGRLWIGDVGSRRTRGQERALYVIDEPGTGDHRVKAERYALRFQGGGVEVEAMTIVPSGFLFFSKGWPNGFTYGLFGQLTESGMNTAVLTGRKAPAWTTDATTTPDGRHVLVRGSVQVDVREVRTWKLVHVDAIPILRQGETIAMEASGQSYLIGSEGKNSPLVRIAFNPATFTAPPPKIDPVLQKRAQSPVNRALREHRDVAALVGAATVVAVAGVVVWRRRRRRRLAAEAQLTHRDS